MEAKPLMGYNTVKRKWGRKRLHELIFYSLFMAWPVIQFCVFYIAVNTNSILLAFKQYDTLTGKYTFIGFDNFKNFVSDIAMGGSPLYYGMRNSLILFGLELLFGIPLALLFSFSIYKKMLGWRVFRVVLFLPSIISGIVIVLIFQYFVNNAIPELVLSLFGIRMEGFLDMPETRLGTIFFYNIFFSFGFRVLMYSSAMSRIPEELVEYGALDGLTHLKEFWHLTLPLIYPTITAFFVLNIAGIFTDQASIYSFFGDEPRDSTIYTIGYYLFIRVQSTKAAVGGLRYYPYASAGGLFCTLIAAPLTLFARWVFEKFGPDAEF